MSTTEIPAKLVMQLRSTTGLPMMKCKEALEACGGDFHAAVDWLRKKGLETAAKKADRVMKEGRVAIRAQNDLRAATMVEVACETEPVRESADFRGFVDALLELAHARVGQSGAGDAPLDAVLAWPMGSATVDTTLKGLVAKIGENMAVRRVVALTGARVGTYLHFNAKVGVLCEVDGPAAALATGEAKQLVEDLGKHVAFHQPVAVSRDQVAREAVEKEMEIYREQAKQDPKLAGKPAPVLERILLGKLDKYYAERVLLEQPWVMDDAQTVKAVLEAVSKKAGGPIAVKRIAVCRVGA